MAFQLRYGLILAAAFAVAFVDVACAHSRLPKALYSALLASHPEQLPMGFSSVQVHAGSIPPYLRSSAPVGLVVLNLNRPPTRILATIEYAVFSNASRAEGAHSLTNAAVGIVVETGHLPRSAGQHTYEIRQASRQVGGQRFTVDLATSQFVLGKTKVAVIASSPAGARTTLRVRLTALVSFAIRHLNSLE